MSQTPCDWCVDENGKHYCPYSDDPTSSMCENCNWEHNERESEEWDES